MCTKNISPVLRTRTYIYNYLKRTTRVDEAYTFLSYKHFTERRVCMCVIAYARHTNSHINIYEDILYFSNRNLSLSLSLYILLSHIARVIFFIRG